jgi:NADPH:quinone reductase-like Zn-dependent oxidoreductase
MGTDLSSCARAIQAQSFAISGLTLSQVPVPPPGRGEVLVRVTAATLNYRDLAVLGGDYIKNLPLPYVPGSDCCGVVEAIGPGVTRFAVGDRIVPTYTQGWHDGKPTPEQRATRTLGAPLQGVLQDYIVVPEDDAVGPPGNLSDIEAAALPIAGLTAWNALTSAGMKPGDDILLQGTGGVSLFALQFAKLAGARVTILSSSDEKLERAKALGADTGINYRITPDWDVAVRDATDGRGVDIVVETIGSTLSKSLDAVAFGGAISLVGFVAGYTAELNVRQLIGPMITLKGIAVGSRRQFLDMNRAIMAGGIQPVIDSVFHLPETAQAFLHLKSGTHFGKIGIQL